MPPARRPGVTVSPDVPAPIGRMLAIVELVAVTGTISVAPVV